MHHLVKFNLSKTFLGLLFIGCCALFVSCEKEVHIDLATSDPVLVVQGQIETGVPPFVLLTHSFGFFSSIDLTTLQNSFIHGATVTITTDGKTIPLKEYSIDTGNNNKIYFYSIDSSNILLGQVNKSYTLTINYNGKTYTSVTKIPNVKMVDTMWAGTPITGNPDLPIGAKELFVNYSDPDTLGNYVRVFTKRNSGPYYPGPVFTDELINGQLVKAIGIGIGYLDSVNVKSDSLAFAYTGDTITLKWCEIDKGVYNFWNTYAFSQQAAGNPFSSPINVKSNISNGAYGVWCGYGTAFRTLIIQ